MWLLNFEERKNNKFATCDRIIHALTHKMSLLCDSTMPSECINVNLKVLEAIYEPEVSAKNSWVHEEHLVRTHHIYNRYLFEWRRAESALRVLKPSCPTSSGELFRALISKVANSLVSPLSSTPAWPMNCTCTLCFSDFLFICIVMSSKGLEWRIFNIVTPSSWSLTCDWHAAKSSGAVVIWLKKIVIHLCSNNCFVGNALARFYCKRRREKP